MATRDEEVADSVPITEEASSTKKSNRKRPTEDSDEEAPKKSKTTKTGVIDLATLLGQIPEERQAFLPWFSQIADRLLNETELVINKSRFRFAEIEFYMNDSVPDRETVVHHDTFAHGDAQQLNSCAEWYFHRQNGKSFKGGTFKGLDISFAPAGVAFGGVLLRALEVVDTGEVIEGSCSLVNRMLAEVGAESVLELVSRDDFDLSITNTEAIIHVVPSKYLKRQITRSPRVGLTLKKPDDHKHGFVMQPYRFISLPQRIKKQRPTVVAALLHEGVSPAQISTLIKLPKGSVEKYQRVFKAAQKAKKAPATFNNKSLKSDDLVGLFVACHAD